jgi:hypothetical protein
MLEYPAERIVSKQIFGPDHPIKWLAVQIECEAIRLAIRDAKRHDPLGMVSLDSRTEYARLGKVVERYAGVAMNAHG